MRTSLFLAVSVLLASAASAQAAPIAVAPLGADVVLASEFRLNVEIPAAEPCGVACAPVAIAPAPGVPAVLAAVLGKATGGPVPLPASMPAAVSPLVGAFRGMPAGRGLAVLPGSPGVHAVTVREGGFIVPRDATMASFFGRLGHADASPVADAGSVRLDALAGVERLVTEAAQTWEGAAEDWLDALAATVLDGVLALHALEGLAAVAALVLAAQAARGARRRWRVRSRLGWSEPAWADATWQGRATLPRGHAAAS